MSVDLHTVLHHELGDLAFQNSVPASGATLGICTSDADTGPFSTVTLSSSTDLTNFTDIVWQEISGEVGDVDIPDHSNLVEIEVKRQGWYVISWSTDIYYYTADSWATGEQLIVRPQLVRGGTASNIRNLCSRHRAFFAGPSNANTANIGKSNLLLQLLAGDRIKVAAKWLDSPGTAGTGTRDIELWHGNFSVIKLS